MNDVGLDKLFSHKQIENVIQKIFPKLKVRVRNCFSEGQDEDVIVVLTVSSGEFPLNLGFAMDILNDDGLFHLICYKLSIELSCRVWCDGTIYGDDDSPYWSAVYDSGKIYLADDVECEFEEGIINPGELKIVGLVPKEKLPDSILKEIKSVTNA